MDYRDLMQLQEVLKAGQGEEEEYDEFEQFRGSMLNPGDIGGGKKKEVAKPNTKLETTINTRSQNQTVEAESKPKPKQKMKETDIWAPDEVSEVPVDIKETRKRPDFDVLFRQRVGTNDVYLGMSNMDPSTSKCQELLLKVYLPGTPFKDVQLDVKEQVVVVQSSKYYLQHVLPYRVNEKDGKAQWVSDKNTLEIRLPIIRDFDF
eukprot:CAMPEP_0176438690 /NCGR_PEP_ID=MMETSP0127-20121128/19452_1 /TAXON_ID=938130 /ORGANISM="Platyophrya macrostoma, Strain WH" /LENGTH=204 /DNA_ID=CAMNT_0017822725 /DNA_START=41 /DNA_END=655 /DNA_ORIENTATION=+